MEKIEKYDRCVHKRHAFHMCVVNSVSVNGDVNYRIKGQRHSRTSTEKNFRKNWAPLATHNEPANKRDNDATLEMAGVLTG